MNLRIYKILLGLFALFTSGLVEGQESTKVNFEGAFWQDSSWVDRSMPASNLDSDSTIIFGKITSGSDIVVGNSNKLIIVDTLIVSGNLEFKKGAILEIREGAVCIVYGDLKLNNSVNLEIGAHLIVVGSIDATANNGSIEVTTESTAAVYVLGDVDTTRIGGIGCGDPSNYVPPEDENGCNYGDIISLEDNENDDGGIYDLIVNNDSLRGVTPIYSEICIGDSVKIESFVTDAVYYMWHDSSGIALDSVNYSMIVDEPGEYFLKLIPAGNNSDTIISYRAKVVEADDSQPVSIYCLSDTFFVSDPSICGANIVLPPLDYSNSCSVDTIYNNITDNGADASGFYPIGITEVIYTVRDKTGITQTCSFNVLVYPDTDNYISASISSSSTTISAGESLDFTNPALNTSANFFWSFPGATPSESRVQNPTGITYDTPGIYTATLVVNNDCESVSRTATINVVANSFLVFEKDTTFTIPDCVIEITIQAWGAGGGGNSIGTNDIGGGGGGGGAYSSSTLTVIPGTEYSIDIGAGGIPGVSGDSTTFGSNIVVASGGESGTGSSGSSGGQNDNSIGTNKYPGGNGGSFIVFGGGGGGSAFTDSPGGNGGTGFFDFGAGGIGTGNGGNGGISTTNPENGTFPGSGGGGLGIGNSTPGSGANGLIVITWTVDFPPEIEVDSIPSIDQGSNQAKIYYTEISGNPTLYAIEFSRLALDSGFVNVDYTALGTSPINVTVPSLTVPGFYGGILKVKSDKGCESEGIPIIISIKDTVAPDITCPDTVWANTDSLCFATNVDLGVLIATDNAYPNRSFNSNSPTPPGREIVIVNDAPKAFPIDTTIVTWIAADATGNIASCEQIVIVKDTIVPTITCTTDIEQNTDPGLCEASVTIVPPIIIENCTIDTLYNDYNNSSVASDFYPLGETEITWTVIDSSGNRNTCVQLVTITDAEKPVIICQEDTIVYTDLDTSGAYVDYLIPEITDNCSLADTTLISGKPSGSFFSIGETINTFSVSDSSGNTSICSFKITVRDTVPPELICPDTVRTITDSACFATNVDLIGITVIENSIDSTIFESSPTPPGRTTIIVNDAPKIFPIDTTIVTWKVVDPSGNSDSCQQIVIVEDIIPPEITCPAPQSSYPADDGTCFFTVPNDDTSLDPNVFSDNCSIDSVSNNFNNLNTLAGAEFPVGSTIVTWSVVDSSGNTTTCPQTIIVAPSLDLSIVQGQDICQSGETTDEVGDPLFTNQTWNLNLSNGVGLWSFYYEIKDTTNTVVDSGTVTDITTPDTTVSYDSPNQTAKDITLTITISNVKDECDVTETNTANNTDTVILLGVPDTGNIITDTD